MIVVPLTLNSKPILTLDESCDRKFGVTPVALHWDGDSMPVQTVPYGLKLFYTLR